MHLDELRAMRTQSQIASSTLAMDDDAKVTSHQMQADWARINLGDLTSHPGELTAVFELLDAFPRAADRRSTLARRRGRGAPRGARRAAPTCTSTCSRFRTPSSPRSRTSASCSTSAATRARCRASSTPCSAAVRARRRHALPVHRGHRSLRRRRRRVAPRLGGVHRGGAADRGRRRRRAARRRQRAPPARAPHRAARRGDPARARRRGRLTARGHLLGRGDGPLRQGPRAHPRRLHRLRRRRPRQRRDDELARVQPLRARRQAAAERGEQRRRAATSSPTRRSTWPSSTRSKTTRARSRTPRSVRAHLLRVRRGGRIGKLKWPTAPPSARWRTPSAPCCCSRTRLRRVFASCSPPHRRLADGAHGHRRGRRGEAAAAGRHAAVARQGRAARHLASQPAGRAGERRASRRGGRGRARDAGTGAMRADLFFLRRQPSHAWPSRALSSEQPCELVGQVDRRQQSRSAYFFSNAMRSFLQRCSRYRDSEWTPMSLHVLGSRLATFSAA